MFHAKDCFTATRALYEARQATPEYDNCKECQTACSSLWRPEDEEAGQRSDETDPKCDDLFERGHVSGLTLEITGVTRLAGARPLD